MREYGCDPIPWRRVYGFAQNSQMLDRGFLFGSIAVILIWFFAPGNALHLSTWSYLPAVDYGVTFTGFGAIAILFFAGEMDRRDKTPRFGKINIMKYPMFIIGLGLFGYWGFLFAHKIENNLTIIFSNPISVIMGIVLVPLVIIGMIKWKTGKNNTHAVV